MSGVEGRRYPSTSLGAVSLSNRKIGVLLRASVPLWLMLFALPARGGIAFVNGTDKSGSGTSATSTGISITATNLLVACADWFTTTVTVSSVTSSPSNTWNSTTQITNSGQVAIQCYYAMNVAGGTTTVTFNFSATTSWGIAVHQYSGAATAAALDQQNGGTGNNSSPNSGSVTTTANGELIFGWTSNSGGITLYTAGTGFTKRRSDNTFYCSEDQVQGTAGAISATFTMDSSSQWAAKVLTFLAAGGAAKPHQLPTLGVGGMSLGKLGTLLYRHPPLDFARGR